MSLPSEYNVFHTATQKVCFLNLLMFKSVNNYCISHLNWSSIADTVYKAQIIGIPRGNKGYPMVWAFQLPVGGLAQL